MTVLKKILLAELLCFQLALVSTAQQQELPKPKFNIVLIVADDLGYADLGCYGQQKIHTPNIDRIAKEGVRFTQFYAGTSVCAPSRNSLLTGMHTGHTSVRGNKGFKPEGQTPLPDSVLTLATVLKRNGYQTAAFGKWGLGYITSSGSPEKKGFDRFFGYNCQTLAHDYYPDHLWDNEQRIELNENKTSDSLYSADLIHRELIMQLLRFEASYTKPFFLYAPYTLPHGDVIAVRDEIYDAYRKEFKEKPVKPLLANPPKNYEPYPHAAFASMVTRFDDYVGEIYSYLEGQGLAENTLFIITSDNGPHRENGGDPDFFQNHGILRGIKRDLYEGGIRVPLIVNWKNKIMPDVVDIPVAAWDLFPTLAKFANNKTPYPTDGIDFWPLLSGTQNKSKYNPHPFFYWEFHENNGRQAVRMGDWKAVRLNVRTNSKAPIELYNLKTDPGESTDLAAGNKKIVRKIRKIMKKEHHSNPDWPLLYREVKHQRD